MKREQIFPLEDRVAELFDTVFPRMPGASSRHSSGRAFRPLISCTLGSLVPGGVNARELQGHRAYLRVDFQDFLEYATSELPPKANLRRYDNQTAVFYDSLQPGGDLREVHATWATPEGRLGLSISDAVIARDGDIVGEHVRRPRAASLCPSATGHFKHAPPQDTWR